MLILKELSKNENLALGLGFFDGVHLGHLELIKKLVQESKKRKVKSAIITFQKNPANYFAKEKIPYIITNKQKEEILANLKIDFLYELDFETLKDIEAIDYLNNIIIKNFNPNLIITGYNHTFGKNKKGNSDFLRKYSKKYGYDYIEIDEKRINGQKISSSIIRNILKKGDIKKANQFLNKPFEIEGRVIKGTKLARKLGYKTANMLLKDDLIKLPLGVYFGYAIVDNKKYKCLISYGTKPTFTDKSQIILEAHIYDFDREIYGQNIKVGFEEKLRNQKKFKNFDELKKQLDKDYLKFKNFVLQYKV